MDPPDSGPVEHGRFIGSKPQEARPPTARLCDRDILGFPGSRLSLHLTHPRIELSLFALGGALEAPLRFSEFFRSFPGSGLGGFEGGFTIHVDPQVVPAIGGALLQKALLGATRTKTQIVWMAGPGRVLMRNTTRFLRFLGSSSSGDSKLLILLRTV